MQVFRGVENTERVSLVCAVISQNHIDYVMIFVVKPCNRRNGVVRLVPCLCGNIDVFVAVFAPAFEDMRGKFFHFFPVLSFKADHAVVPVDNRHFDVFKGTVGEKLFGRRAHFGQYLTAALIMVVRQNAAADDGQIRVAADEVIGEEFHKVEHSFKGIGVDVHRAMFVRKRDAVVSKYT